MDSNPTSMQTWDLENVVYLRQTFYALVENGAFLGSERHAVTNVSGPGIAGTAVGDAARRLGSDDPGTRSAGRRGRSWPARSNACRGDLVSGCSHSGDAVVRQIGRPLRPKADPAGRGRSLCCRCCAVRDGNVDSAADCVPGRARAGWRRAHGWSAGGHWRNRQPP